VCPECMFFCNLRCFLSPNFYTISVILAPTEYVISFGFSRFYTFLCDCSAFVFIFCLPWWVNHNLASTWHLLHDCMQLMQCLSQPPPNLSPKFAVCAKAWWQCKKKEQPFLIKKTHDIIGHWQAHGEWFAVTKQLELSVSAQIWQSKSI
jgi:hypothetical protein